MAVADRCDAWGHYLTALRNQYELLKHPFFNWLSRAESYNLQDIVITVDFLDELPRTPTGKLVKVPLRDRYRTTAAPVAG